MVLGYIFLFHLPGRFSTIFQYSDISGIFKSRGLVKPKSKNPEKKFLDIFSPMVNSAKKEKFHFRDFVLMGCSIIPYIDVR